MVTSRRLAALAGALAALSVTAAAAETEGTKQRIFEAGGRGPQVIELDPYPSQFRRGSVGRNGEDVHALGAIPVPQVMNGGAFGMTGFDYYHDASAGGFIGKRRIPHGYVLAPALRAPLP